MTDSQKCPTKDCDGTLATYHTRPRSTGNLQRSRECKCCGYREVALVRPAEVISVRCIRPGQYRPETPSDDMDQTQ